ncbi:MAG: D-tyrosyl-tRNA(Tyr) deacylase [Crocinitomicaceae bacterium]|nr:D-tyrosyl-tRNA(Tyr) deacylase [Crocinitomicaceae bacterium]MBK8927333.1 D-tyrosyl-tRNA(Tyr) deacylase [Crocinitomicaceae bacterium]
MRTVIQRVSSASVSIDGKVHGAIDSGLLVLVGFETADTEDDLKWLAQKICNLRIFSDDHGLMNLSVKDINGNILLISQFTLHAKTKKGNRPSFIDAARPEQAIPLYEKFISQLELELNHPIQTGIFGANMQVSLTNDGPVTIWVDTKNKES